MTSVGPGCYCMTLIQTISFHFILTEKEKDSITVIFVVCKMMTLVCFKIDCYNS